MKYSLNMFKTNSQFFYGKKINIDYFDNYFTFNINPDSLNQKKLENLIEGVTSSTNYFFLYLSTSNGDFLFSGLDNYLKTNVVCDFLKYNSSDNSILENRTFYFESNAINQSARFGAAQNGVLAKYIAKNLPTDEDPSNEVEWIKNFNNLNDSLDFIDDNNSDFTFDVLKNLIDKYIPNVFDNLLINKVSILHKSSSKIKLSDSLELDIFKKRAIDKLSDKSIKSAFEKISMLGQNNFLITIDTTKDNIYLHSFLLCEIDESEFLFSNIAYKLDKYDDFIAYDFNNSIISMVDDIKYAEVRDLEYISRFIRKIPDDTKRFVLAFEFYKPSKFVIKLIHFPDEYPLTLYDCKKFNTKTSKEILDFILNLSPTNLY